MLSLTVYSYIIYETHFHFTMIIALAKLEIQLCIIVMHFGSESAGAKRCAIISTWDIILYIRSMY